MTERTPDPSGRPYGVLRRVVPLVFFIRYELSITVRPPSRTVDEFASPEIAYKAQYLLTHSEGRGYLIGTSEIARP